MNNQGVIKQSPNNNIVVIVSGARVGAIKNKSAPGNISRRRFLYAICLHAGLRTPVSPPPVVPRRIDARRFRHADSGTPVLMRRVCYVGSGTSVLARRFVHAGSALPVLTRRFCHVGLLRRFATPVCRAGLARRFGHASSATPVSARRFCRDISAIPVPARRFWLRRLFVHRFQHAGSGALVLSRRFGHACSL